MSEAFRHDLDGDLSIQLRIFCPVDLAHAPFTNRRKDLIRTQPRSYRKGRLACAPGFSRKLIDRLCHGGPYDILFRIVASQQRLDLSPQFVIAGAGACQERTTLDRREVGGIMKQLLDSSPTLVAHAKLPSRRKRLSHASASRRSRLTVKQVRPSAVAISSLSIPPK